MKGGDKRSGSEPAKKKVGQAKPLIDEEWKFDSVDERELHACFYYEFARSSKLICEGVELWRTNFSRSMAWRRTSLQAVKTNWFRITRSAWKPGNLSMSHLDDLDDGYCSASAANEDAESLKPDALSKADPRVLDLVAAFEEFPSVPWLKITDREKRAEFAAAWRVPDLQHCERAIASFDHILEACDLQGLSAWREVKRTEKAPANAHIRIGLHLFGISWNYRDEEIAAAVEAWCVKNRPPEYPEAQTRKAMAGLDLRKLPFAPRTGLEYMGVLRRRNACGKTPWKEFFERWPPPAFDQIMRELRRARKSLRLKAAEDYDAALQADAFARSDNIIRDLQDKCARVERFIAQLECGVG